MGLVSGKRIVIPLTGHSDFDGNIKIVLDSKKQRVEIHINQNIRSSELNVPNVENIVTLDAGITEVFTDELGNRYGTEFGKMLSEISKQQLENGKARNKIRYLRSLTSSKYKQKRIEKNNLSKNKLNERRIKSRIRIKQEISEAVHQVVKTRKPSILITEKLDIRGKAKSKGMSRLVNTWMRGSLKERLEFSALVEGFHHKQVNPAYTSQMCPFCWFVSKDNRKGDRFKCLNCGHVDVSDRVAAQNLKARYYDHEITIYTHKSVVKSILHERFIASLQSQT